LHGVRRSPQNVFLNFGGLRSHVVFQGFYGARFVPVHALSCIPQERNFEISNPAIEGATVYMYFPEMSSPAIEGATGYMYFPEMSSPAIEGATVYLYFPAMSSPAIEGATGYMHFPQCSGAITRAMKTSVTQCHA
jgi:hypothetical protein